MKGEGGEESDGRRAPPASIPVTHTTNLLHAV